MDVDDIDPSTTFVGLELAIGRVVDQHAVRRDQVAALGRIQRDDLERRTRGRASTGFTDNNACPVAGPDDGRIDLEAVVYPSLILADYNSRSKKLLRCTRTQNVWGLES